MNEKIGIVICSRSDSKRCPNKPFIRIDGKYIIAHLLDRLLATGINIYIAVPECEYKSYKTKLADYINWKNVFLFGGSKDDPLKRTHQVAKQYDIDHIVRVTHDKIFISYRQVDYLISQYLEKKLDYIYSTNFIAGTGFEVFSAKVLKRAHDTFKNVEHLSYAIETVANSVLNIQRFPLSRTWLNRLKPQSNLRLLIDYPEDIVAIKKLMANLGATCELTDIVSAIENKPQSNSLPDVTVYTCSYNDVAFLDRCIASVLSQSFASFEYILVDDGSRIKDVSRHMEKHTKNPRVKFFRNGENVGLASSSNIANDLARGRYVIRLDADDYFVDEKVIDRMFRHMELNSTDILYPHNYKDGSIQDGSESHHVGGTMFRKRTLDYIKFTDGLRHFEGLDLYKRAQLKGARIDYFNEPTFYYRQRFGSMSKDTSIARKTIEKNLSLGFTGEQLLRRSAHG